MQVVGHGDHKSRADVFWSDGSGVKTRPHDDADGGGAKSVASRGFPFDDTVRRFAVGRDHAARCGDAGQFLLQGCARIIPIGGARRCLPFWPIGGFGGGTGRRGGAGHEGDQ